MKKYLLLAACACITMRTEGHTGTLEISHGPKYLKGMEKVLYETSTSTSRSVRNLPKEEQARAKEEQARVDRVLTELRVAELHTALIQTQAALGTVDSELSKVDLESLKQTIQMATGVRTASRKVHHRRRRA